jgi:electron transport protein HydN
MEIVAREAVLEQRQPANGNPPVEAYKCDLCIHRPQGPSCIEVCPTKAIYTIDAKVLSDSLRKKREQAALAQL